MMNSRVTLPHHSLFLTSTGGRAETILDLMVPFLSATAHAEGDTQVRTLAGRGYCQQGGLEVARRGGFFDKGPTLAREALDFLAAPNCPSEKMDLVLAPDQMLLQIHESLGHPLELDRILGDIL